MSKAIVITRSINDCTDEEKELLNSTEIFKVCVNYARCKCDYRLFHDYGWCSVYATGYTEPLITYNAAKPLVEKRKLDIERFHLFYKAVKTPNTLNKDELFFKMGSIIPAIDFCIKSGALNILLIADNKVYNDIFQETIKKCVDELKQHAQIFSHVDANLNVETCSVKDFLSKKIII